jgi:hypothetical protein
MFTVKRYWVFEYGFQGSKVSGSWQHISMEVRVKEVHCELGNVIFGLDAALYHRRLESLSAHL